MDSERGRVDSVDGVEHVGVLFVARRPDNGPGGVEALPGVLGGARGERTVIHRLVKLQQANRKSTYTRDYIIII